MKKITVRILMLSLTVMSLACSKDEENVQPAPLRPGLSENDILIQAPANLKTSDDPMAQTALGYIELANSISTNFSYFEIPPGATTSDTPIVPINGRTSGTTKYTVYSWTDQSEHQFSYQVGEYDDKYTFEMFWKLKGQTGWTRLLFAEENKAKTLGIFIIYDFTGSDASKEFLRYDWSRIGEAFKLKIAMEDAFYDFDINTKTGAGNVKFYSNDVLYYKLIWDAQGNGTWSQYDESGAEVESGSWTV